MTTLLGPVDYVKICFIHPTLTTIQVEPNYSSLKIKKKLQADTSKVTPDLGGVVLTPHKYSMISVVLYARPVHPGTLNIPAGTTQHKSMRLTLAHTEVIRVYHGNSQIGKGPTQFNVQCNTRYLLQRES